MRCCAAGSLAYARPTAARTSPPGGLDLSLLELNPPDHTRIRRLAAPAFTPRRMAGYAGTGRPGDHRLLDQCEREREFDLMTAFASPLPIAVMTQLLGLPNDPERFRRLGSTIGQALDGDLVAPPGPDPGRR